jgi:hypothetical protein
MSALGWNFRPRCLSFCVVKLRNVCRTGLAHVSLEILGKAIVPPDRQPAARSFISGAAPSFDAPAIWLQAQAPELGKDAGFIAKPNNNNRARDST